MTTRIVGLVLGLVLCASLASAQVRTDVPVTEDTAHTSGDRLVPVMGVRNDGGGTLADTDLDYAPLQLDADGKLVVTTATPNIQYNEDTAHNSGDVVTMAGAIVNDSPDAISSEGDVTVLSTDAEGRLHAAALLVDGNGAALSLAADVAEDTAHSNAAAGPVALTRRIDTSASSADTSGDYATVNQDENGAAYVTVQATNSGGASNNSYISVGSTEDEHAVCTAACTLYSITVTNANASPRYLKCENDTAAGTAPGTDTP